MVSKEKNITSFFFTFSIIFHLPNKNARRKNGRVGLLVAGWLDVLPVSLCCCCCCCYHFRKCRHVDPLTAYKPNPFHPRTAWTIFSVYLPILKIGISYFHSLNMKTFVAFFSCLFFAGSALAQDQAAYYECPEPNGLFRDPEQCDLYHVCVDGIDVPELCEDGLLFDDSKRNKEQCKLPYNVDCGGREFVQERAPDIDDRCPHKFGFFDHEDPNVCNKFYNCDKGRVVEQECPPSTVFDVKYGNCVHAGTESDLAKVCGDKENQNALKTVEGFTCPGKETIGPNGLLQAHPVFPHPTDCQFFFTCFFAKDPNKFGCLKGQVFDGESLTCKQPEDVADCKCWYECPEDSNCPDSCNADCSCPQA